MGKIGILLVLLVLSGCGDKMKQSAVFAITQAKADISMVRINSDVRKEKVLLANAESMVTEAEVSLKNKDYTNAKTLAEKASAEAKSVLAKAKEKKASKKKKTPVKKSSTSKTRKGR